MDCERKTDLGDAERQAIQKLDSELRSHGIVSQRAYNLTGAVLARMPEARLRDVSQSRKVAEECARARRVRFVPLHQLESITEAADTACLQGYPAENVECPLRWLGTSPLGPLNGDC